MYKSIDIDKIRNYFKFENAIIGELVMVQKKELELFLEEFKSNILSNNLEGVRAEIHKIKPSFEYFGTKKLEIILTNLRSEIINMESISSPTIYLKEVTKEIRRIQSDLSKYLKTLKY